MVKQMTKRERFEELAFETKKVGKKGKIKHLSVDQINRILAHEYGKGYRKKDALAELALIRATPQRTQKEKYKRKWEYIIVTIDQVFGSLGGEDMEFLINTTLEDIKKRRYNKQQLIDEVNRKIDALPKNITKKMREEGKTTSILFSYTVMVADSKEEAESVLTSKGDPGWVFSSRQHKSIVQFFLSMLENKFFVIQNQALSFLGEIYSQTKDRQLEKLLKGFGR